MKARFPGFKHLRRTSSKMSSLLLLLQRSPLVQMILPEARILGGAGLGEAVKWTVAAYAGLSAYDGIAGASGVSQVSPAAGSTTVNGAVGSGFSFIFQVTGTETWPLSWQISGAIPNGLTLANTIGSNDYADSISGIPTLAGNYPITITAWEFADFQGESLSQSFTLSIGSAIITAQPQSVSINSGSTTVLSVTGSGTGLTYQWYSGDSPSTAAPISGATSSTYTTPALNSQAKYWVRVTRPSAVANSVIANSSTATVSINPSVIQPTITQQPSSPTINAGETATLTVVTSGSAATYQWYEGNPPSTSIPVFSGGASFTTPVLAATKTYWVKATNSGGSASSNAAVVTVRTLRETWANSIFTSGQLADPLVSGPTANPDHDELTNDGEYIFGTSPLAFDGSLMSVSRTGANEISIQFVAKTATGSGYYGKTRHYALESRADLTSGQWDPVSGYADITGSGQTVTVPFAPGGKAFYHLKAWLTP